MRLQGDLSWAVELAEEAGTLIACARDNGFEQSLKDDNSIVTSADLASDEILRTGIQRHAPNDALLTEEAGWFPGTSGNRTWVVDPLDGTRAFTMGQEGVSVLLGLIEGGSPVLGIAHFPFEKTTYWAVKGEGAFKKNLSTGRVEPLPAPRRMNPALMALSPSTPPEKRKALLAKTGLQLGPLLHGAGAKFMCVADGRASAYFSGHGLSLWDTAGPGVILKELGCRVTSDRGHDLIYNVKGTDWTHNGGIVVTAELEHQQVIRHIQEVES